MKKNLNDYFVDSKGHQTPVKSYEQLLKEKEDIEKQLKHHVEKEMADRVEILLKSGVYHWKDDKGRLIVPAQHWSLDMIHHQRLPNDEEKPQILSSKDYHTAIKKYYGGRHGQLPDARKPVEIKKKAKEPSTEEIRSFLGEEDTFAERVINGEYDEDLS